MRISTLFSCQYLILNFPHRVCTYENIDLLTIAHCFLIRYAHRWCFFVCASALTVVSAGCRRPRFSADCAIFSVVMTRKWGRRTRFRQNNRYFGFFLAMEKSMWYTGAEYNSECAGGLHRCGLGAPLLRAVAGNVCTHDRDPVHRRRRDIAAPHGGLTEPGRRP